MVFELGVVWTLRGGASDGLGFLVHVLYWGDAFALVGRIVCANKLAIPGRSVVFQDREGPAPLAARCIWGGCRARHDAARSPAQTPHAEPECHDPRHFPP